MTYFEALTSRIKSVKSHLCIGIDPDRDKLSALHVNSKSSFLEYIRSFIEHTSPYAAAYKPNIAFFEGWGPDGWEVFQHLRSLIPSSIPVIADAKRSDIGNSARWYARTFFDLYKVDAITVNPLLGNDSITPFTDYEDKGTYILCLTSNPGARDFQLPDLYQNIAQWCRNNDQHANIGIVAGATQDNFTWLSQNITCPFLIPGIGSQGGSITQVQKALRIRMLPDIVNVSRAIMFPPDEEQQYWENVKKTTQKYHAILATGEDSQ